MAEDSAKLQYHCRRCSQDWYSPYLPATVAGHILVAIAEGRVHIVSGTPIYRALWPHACADGGTGLMDLHGMGAGG